MASSFFLYLLKISLYQKQYVTNRQNIINANILAEYVALIHAQYFLRCPLIISAPRLDRDLWVDILRYKECFRVNMPQSTMIKAVQNSVLNYLWSFTGELMIFAHFDIDVKEDERHSLVVKLLSIQVTE